MLSNLHIHIIFRYFWAAITATLAGILCACSLWKRHNSNNLFCCRDSARDERASEPDSNGSCYNPPQYSRCNSFYQAPPPYSEVIFYVIPAYVAYIISIWVICKLNKCLGVI